MKKLFNMMLVAMLTFSLSACGSKKPSIDEVEKAINEGTVTVEDALSKGWVDEAWVEEYNEAQLSMSVPASDKLTSNMIGEYETTTQSGETFTNSNIEGLTFYAFINPESEAGKDAYSVLTENDEAIREAGGYVLVINTSTADTDLFADAKFPVVAYNDSMKTALGSLSDMVQEDGFSGSWNSKGAFLSAWNSKIDSDKLIDTISGLLEMIK